MFCCTESHLQVDLYLQNNHLLWEDISSCYFLCSHHNWEWLVADYWLLLKYCFLILNKGWHFLGELLNSALFISASWDVALTNCWFNLCLYIILLRISLSFIETIVLFSLVVTKSPLVTFLKNCICISIWAKL